MRSPALVVLIAAMAAAAGCDGKAEPAAKADTQPEAKPEPVDRDADRPADDANQASFATPTAKPPPPPDGAITLADPWLYVQSCAEPNPCPALKQPAGDVHCRELVLGGHDSWRLPSKAEVERFAGVPGLTGTAGYHWTRTPYEDDLGQVWIVDPEDPDGAPATTIPRDRKPFLIRCVKEP